MTDAPGSLGDFFAKKKKKNIKPTNLNNEAANPRIEEKRKPTKDKEEEGWEDEQIAVPTMKVEVAGKLTKEDEKKDEEDTAAPAWRIRGDASRNNDLSDKKYPTLAKAVRQSSNINIDDGSDPHLNIKTTKNAFAALHENDDSGEEGPRRPKEIKPAMVQKRQGERASIAIQREVDKYAGPVDDHKKKKEGKKKKEAEEEEEEDEEEEPVDGVEEKKKKNKEDKKQDRVKGPTRDEEVESVEVMEDVKIQPDLEASRKKYQGRQKLSKKELPASELEVEKENRPPKAQQAASGGKKSKKKMYVEEEFEKPRLLVADWD
eukprot:CAMPEP_0115289250 /NCGR_PEP_ID=MMETSP0270-20121206/63407_1 /TAXON_ID=71861 /ORGANISM="Scrippsiella trochoidea, Strain CCMP3099" /LENGTH=317 /DNA_ID=CAMNT_0002706413 /DNA_START=56 /DNA_END=1009 /DNA_ORIENTATION=+